MAVGAEEPHLSDTLIFLRIQILIRLRQKFKGRIHTGNGIVEPLPYIVDIPGRGHNTCGDFQRMEHVPVLCSVSSLVCVIGAYIVVPQRE